MTVNERRKYLKLVAPCYGRAGWPEWGALLTKIATVTGLHRKSLVRLLYGSTLDSAPKRPRVRSRTYAPAVAAVVRVVWEAWTTSAPSG